MKSAPAKTCPSCAERYEADVLFCPRDGTPLVNAKAPSFSSEGDPYLGLELGGQIRIKHLIGVGSMGRVYRAFQAGIERDVAVKILHRELSGNAELVARFHREAKVASRLVHPNVVQVLMTGAVPFASDAPRRDQADPRVGGELYLVMEHLDGISLLSALAAAGTAGEGAALPLTRALHIALQLCDAVGEAHTQGIVHRDVKPENVMLIRRGDDPDFVKVLDFGIARLDWADRGMATQAGLIFGTAKYISPEGAEGQRVGPSADVYSIATILYQCLAGRTPFEGDSPVALLVQHTHAPPPNLRSIARASYVPTPIADVVMRNLAKRPGDRAANARVLGRDLVAAVRASGLDPEEIVSLSGLVNRSAGPVKLASNQRTKALDLSPELAARIGAVAAHRGPDDDDAAFAEAEAPAAVPRRSEHAHAVGPPPLPGALEAGGEVTTVPGEPHWLAQEPVEQTLNDHEEAQGGARSTADRARASAHAADAVGGRTRLGGTPIPARPSGATGTPMPGGRRPSVPGRAGPSQAPRSRGAAWEGDANTAPYARPAEHALAGGPSARHAPVEAELDFDDADPRRMSTMQGTETTFAASEPPPARRHVVRAAVAVAAAATLLAAVLLGGRKLGALGASASGDGIEAQIEAARECMRRHAWDAPARQNVKEITDAALARWPGDARIAELRREASERLIADALGRKYGGDRAGAQRLAHLAEELDPASTTAQHLVADVEGASAAPDVAPATGEPTAPEHAAPRATAPRKANPAPGTPPRPAPSGAPAAGSATLPPPPPPGELKPLPAPSGTGPWL